MSPKGIRIVQKLFTFSFFPLALLMLLGSLLCCCTNHSVNSDDYKERRKALSRIDDKDQEQLTEIALDNRDDDIAGSAAFRLTNQVHLEKVAVGSSHSKARRVAFRKLTAPSRLAQILDSEPNKAIPFVENQTDRTYLSELGKNNERGFNMWRQKSDESTAIFIDDRDLWGDLNTWRNCGIIASLKLSLEDPTIQSRLGGLKLLVDRAGTHKNYARYTNAYSYIGSAGTIDGEQVTIRIVTAPSNLHDASIIVKETFNSDFPPGGNTYASGKPILFIGAEISAERILSGLLHRSEFTAGDIQNIATNSAIADLRACAVSSIDNEELLVKIAKDDPAAQVRFAAVKRIHKQETLFEIAMNKQEKLRIRITAATAVTDSALKKKLAANNSEQVIRKYSAKSP